MPDEHPNAKAVGAFLEQIAAVSRPVVRTEKINDQAVLNGYTAAFYDEKRGVGFTVICWDEGRFKVHVEMAGSINQAEAFGQMTSNAIVPSVKARDAA